MLGELTATLRYVVHFYRAGLKDRHPIGAPRKPTKNNRILFRIEFRNEVVTGLRRGKVCRHRQTSLGVEGKDHGGIIPLALGGVKRPLNSRIRWPSETPWDFGE
jgi:hypothetical protein